jgi:hypothetical protein
MKGIADVIAEALDMAPDDDDIDAVSVHESFELILPHTEFQKIVDEYDNFHTNITKVPLLSHINMYNICDAKDAKTRIVSLLKDIEPKLVKKLCNDDVEFRRALAHAIDITWTNTTVTFVQDSIYTTYIKLTSTGDRSSKYAMLPSISDTFPCIKSKIPRICAMMTLFRYAIPWSNLYSGAHTAQELANHFHELYVFLRDT